MCGDNKNSVHYPKTLGETPEIIVTYCERCKKRVFVRKLQGRPERDKYNNFFRIDTLQPNSNLYYKVYPNRMKIIS